MVNGAWQMIDSQYNATWDQKIHRTFVIAHETREFFKYIKFESTKACQLLIGGMEMYGVMKKEL